MRRRVVKGRNEEGERGREYKAETEKMSKREGRAEKDQAKKREKVKQ